MVATAPPRLLDETRLSPLVDAVLGAAARETPWRRAFLQQIAPRAEDVIVEIGCGAGAMTLMLAQANPRAILIAIDSDEEALARASARAREAGRTITFLRGTGADAAHLTAQWAPTKIVCSLLMHTAAAHEKLAILRAAHAALRADGVLHCAEYGAQERPLMRALFTAMQGVAAPEPGAFARLMREAGFRAVDEARRFDTLSGSISLFTARQR